jgi:hypothetical protein
MPDLRIFGLSTSKSLLTVLRRTYLRTEPVAIRQAQEEPEPEGRLSAVELAPIKGTSKYAADVLIVLFALSLAAGLVWFFAMD